MTIVQNPPCLHIYVFPQDGRPCAEVMFVPPSVAEWYLPCKIIERLRSDGWSPDRTGQIACIRDRVTGEQRCVWLRGHKRAKNALAKRVFAEMVLRESETKEEQDDATVILA